MQRHLVLAAAVVLMLTGAGMIIGGLSAGIAIPLITIGVALTIIIERGKRRQAQTSH